MSVVSRTVSILAFILLLSLHGSPSKSFKRCLQKREVSETKNNHPRNVHNPLIDYRGRQNPKGNSNDHPGSGSKGNPNGGSKRARTTPKSNARKRTPRPSNKRTPAGEGQNDYRGNLARRIRKFTRAFRKYEYLAGRPTESRPRGFLKCLAGGKCRNDNHCKRRSVRTKRAVGPSCLKCNADSQCSPYGNKADRWRGKILEESFNEETKEGKLVIPGRKIPFYQFNDIGKLVYSIKTAGDGQTYAFLDGIKTNGRFQGKGVGTAMLRHFIEEVVLKKHSQAKRVSLWLYPGRGENDAAEKLYKNFGFGFDREQEQHWMSLSVEDYKGYRGRGYSPKPNL